MEPVIDGFVDNQLDLSVSCFVSNRAEKTYVNLFKRRELSYASFESRTESGHNIYLVNDN